MDPEAKQALKVIAKSAAMAVFYLDWMRAVMVAKGDVDDQLVLDFKFFGELKGEVAEALAVLQKMEES